MKEYSDITLDFTHPPKQAETYEYHLGEDFFEGHERDEVLGGEVDLVITVTPITESRLDLTFSYTGKMSVVCDRCLAPMTHMVDTEEYVNVILGTELNDENDEEITLDAQDPVYDFAWIAYELLALSLPSIHVHEDIEECDPEVVSHLSIEPPTSDDPDSDIWAELKQKINKNKSNN